MHLRMPVCHLFICAYLPAISLVDEMILNSLAQILNCMYLRMPSHSWIPTVSSVCISVCVVYRKIQQNTSKIYENTNLRLLSLRCN